MEFLASGDLTRGLEILCGLPARQVINPLFSLLLSTDREIKWAAVTAFGAVVSGLACEDMESARVVMRRLMWQLNDESGGIGWGCPEAMGETMARHEGLGEEFSRVLVSYIDEDGNYLEYEPLQEGVLWGLARLAQARPHLVREAEAHLGSFLDHQNVQLKGLALLIVGFIKTGGYCDKIEKMLGNAEEIEVFLNREFRIYRIGDLARAALEQAEGDPG